MVGYVAVVVVVVMVCRAFILAWKCVCVITGSSLLTAPQVDVFFFRAKEPFVESEVIGPFAAWTEKV